MAVLNVNFESLDTLSSTIASKGDEFSTLLSKIQSQNESLKAVWEGTDAVSYTAKVDEQAMQMQKLADAIAEISVFLRNASDAYRKAQEANMVK